jgi:hypothetical protein
MCERWLIRRVFDWHHARLFGSSELSKSFQMICVRLVYG